MKLLDRITQRIIDSNELLHIDVIIPQRYILTEDWQHKSHVTSSGSFLFFDKGSLRIEVGQVLHCEEYNVSSTVEQSIQQIAQKIQFFISNKLEGYLPNPLIPNNVFDSTLQHTKFDEMLQDVMEEGHLHHIAHKPRMDMRYDEELVDVSRAKKIANNAHRYLASHSETWQQRSLVGIRPKKVLARLSEDELLIYENRVFVNLLDKIKFYLLNRLNDLKEQYLNLEEALDLGNSSSTFYKLSYELYGLWAKNLSISETENIISKLDYMIKENQKLLERIQGLQSVGLYIRIPPQLRRVSDQLHKTNILNYDQHYRHLSRLWTELYTQSVRQLSLEEKWEENSKFQHDYAYYSLLIILHAFTNLGFKCSTLQRAFSFRLERSELIITLSFDRNKLCWILSYKQENLTIFPFACQITGNTFNNFHLMPDTVVFALDKSDSCKNIIADKIFWVNPTNFKSIENFTVLLLEWIYRPILQMYSSDLELGKIPHSVQIELERMTALNKSNQKYQLVSVLQKDELDLLHQICENSNTDHIYKEILNHQKNILNLTKCPICLSESEFEARTTNKTFIATCTNLECAVRYMLNENSNSIRRFSLKAKGDWHEGGRWDLSFKVSTRGTEN